ncbi:hypothetical protein [Enterobacter cloacae]|uniref:hypothetical protein n=1 Tax=Enterobacter cloacae TaxID=550 RepID=UPI000666FB2E|nr:hypothetical protein [Enterobacter cloacae]
MDESRKQFDEAYERMQYDHFGSNRDFAWKFWQASRTAIEIELPMKKAEHAPHQSVFNSGIDASAKAIRAAGIKAKE